MEKSKKQSWLVRNLFVTDQYGPIALRLFAFVSYMIAALGIFLAWNPGGSVPPKESLQSFSGTLTRAERGDYGIRIYFEKEDPVFEYISKADAINVVWNSVKFGALVEILYEEQKNFGERVTVYQIAIDGSMIRSYEDIRQAFVDDDKIGWWLFFGFLVSGSYLLVSAHYTEKNTELLEDERRKVEAGVDD